MLAYLASDSAKFGCGENENMRRHQGGRKRMFSPAEASNFGVLGKVVQLPDTVTVEYQTPWHHGADGILGRRHSGIDRATDVLGSLGDSRQQIHVVQPRESSANTQQPRQICGQRDALWTADLTSSDLSAGESQWSASWSSPSQWCRSSASSPRPRCTSRASPSWPSRPRSAPAHPWLWLTVGGLTGLANLLRNEGLLLLVLALVAAAAWTADRNGRLM